MIGRTGPVKHHHLDQWARDQAAQRKLTSLEAHVLLVLASYCDADCVCWPSRQRLMADTQRSLAQVRRGLRGLEDKQLIWTKQGGNGRTAKRELLYGRPSSRVAGDPASDERQRASRVAGDPSAGSRATPRTSRERPRTTGSSTVSGSSFENVQGSRVAGDPALSPPATTNNDNGNDGGVAETPAAVRAAIRDSLADALPARPCNCERPLLADGGCARCGRAAA